MSVKPILFNSDMVRAILANQKTVTRRVVKPQPPENTPRNYLFIPPYHHGDILYVRETFCGFMLPCGKIVYHYKASEPNGNRTPTGPEYDDELDVRPWRPSIHMPKEAARLFLRVTAVRVERLKDITVDAICKEGVFDVGINPDDFLESSAYMFFEELWDSTIKKSDLSLYGWEANPYVFVIEFERISKEEAAQ